MEKGETNLEAALGYMRGEVAADHARTTREDAVLSRNVLLWGICGVVPAAIAGIMMSKTAVPSGPPPSAPLHPSPPNAGQKTTHKSSASAAAFHKAVHEKYLADARKKARSARERERRDLKSRLKALDEADGEEDDEDKDDGEGGG